MDLSLITARITDQVSALSVGDRIHGAAELEAVRANTLQIVKPSVFVVWTGDTAEDQSPVPGQEARFREDFAVVAAVDNSVDPHGGVGVASLETLGTALSVALVGWTPSSEHLPVYYAGSIHVEMDTERLIHSFNYSTVKPGGSIFTYRIGFRVSILPGIDPALVFLLYAGKVNAVIGANTRLTSDYLLDREAIPESATRYQLRMTPASVDDRLDSSRAFTDLSVVIEVHHHLAPGDTERTYTETTMVTALSTLLPPAYWRDSTKVKTVGEPPTLGLGADLTRE